MPPRLPKLDRRVPAVPLAKLDFSRPELLRSSLTRLKPQPKQVGALVSESLRVSPANAQLLAQALIVPASARPTQADRDAADANAGELVRWAASHSREERRVVVRAFAQASRKRDLISGVAQLQQPQSRAFIKDYFEEGGDLASIVHWLGEAGAVLRVAHKRELAAPPVDGFFDDMWNAVKKGASDVVDAVGEAVNTVVDAVVSAGRTLADIFNAAAHWTASQIEDLVETLIDAGRKTVDILVAAAKLGAEAIRGAVQGLVRAGRALADIVKWAAGQAASAVLTAIDSILDLGRSVASVMAEAVKLAARELKAVVEAIIRSGRKVGQVLATVAQRGASIIKTTLEGVLSAGVYLADVVAGVCRDVAEAFRAGFISGLIALGKGAVDIFKAALESGLGIAALAFAAILEAIGGHRPLTANELREARRVFGNAEWLTRVKVGHASLPADLIQAVNGGRPFTTMYVLNYSSKKDFKPDGELKSLSTLIHELTHVWQGVQDGPIYMIEALEAQIRGHLDSTLPGDAEAYTYTDEQLKAHGGDLSKFSREAQANIVEDYYDLRFARNRPQAEWAKLQPYADKVKDAQTFFERLRPVVVPPIVLRPINLRPLNVRPIKVSGLRR